METNELRPKPSSYLALAIISTVLCCLPTGIVSIIYAAKVNEAYASGDYEKAVQSSKNAKTWALVGIGLAVLIWIVYFAFFGLAMFASLNQSNY